MLLTDMRRVAGALLHFSPPTGAPGVPAQMYFQCVYTADVYKLDMKDTKTIAVERDD